MKTKKHHNRTSFVVLLVQAMCLSVLLSHNHVKDVVALSRSEPTHPGSASLTKLNASDIHTKALGDLHHHIDKTSVKNMSVQTAAARRRDLVPSVQAVEPSSLGQVVYDFFLRLGVVLSLVVSGRTVTLEDV